MKEKYLNFALIAFSYPAALMSLIDYSYKLTGDYWGWVDEAVLLKAVISAIGNNFVSLFYGVFVISMIALPIVTHWVVNRRKKVPYVLNYLILLGLASSLNDMMKGQKYDHIMDRILLVKFIFYGILCGLAVLYIHRGRESMDHTSNC